MPDAIGDLNRPDITTRGFTGHEQLNNLSLTHMNGRVYDYNLGRFLSVDPVIQFPSNSQSLNPYSYILNNPLSGTDPTGYTVQCPPVRGSGCPSSETYEGGDLPEPDDNNGRETGGTEGDDQPSDTNKPSDRDLVEDQSQEEEPAKLERIEVLEGSAPPVPPVSAGILALAGVTFASVNDSRSNSKNKAFETDGTFATLALLTAAAILVDAHDPMGSIEGMRGADGVFNEESEVGTESEDEDGNYAGTGRDKNKRGREKTKGANKKDKQQIDDVANSKGIKNRRKFGKFVEEVKRSEGRGGSDNFGYDELLELADEYKNNGGK